MGGFGPMWLTYAIPPQRLLSRTGQRLHRDFWEYLPFA